MKIKIMYPNSHGKLEFSKEELEQILKEAYDEGVADGMNLLNSSSVSTTFPPYIYNSPTVTCLSGTGNDISLNDSVTITTTTDDVLTYCSTQAVSND